MDAQYKTARQQAVKLQSKFRDSLDDKSQPISRTLESEIERIVDDFEVKKNPRSIDDRIKQLQRQLRDLDRGDPPIMDNRHAEDLYDSFEDLRLSLRNFENF